jgi:hypothetical protein
MNNFLDGIAVNIPPLRSRAAISIRQKKLPSAPLYGGNPAVCVSDSLDPWLSDPASRRVWLCLHSILPVKSRVAANLASTSVYLLTFFTGRSVPFLRVVLVNEKRIFCDSGTNDLPMRERILTTIGYARVKLL